MSISVSACSGVHPMSASTLRKCDNPESRNRRIISSRELQIPIALRLSTRTRPCQRTLASSIPATQTSWICPFSLCTPTKIPAVSLTPILCSCSSADTPGQRVGRFEILYLEFPLVVPAQHVQDLGVRRSCRHQLSARKSSTTSLGKGWRDGPELYVAHLVETPGAADLTRRELANWVSNREHGIDVPGRGIGLSNLARPGSFAYRDGDGTDRGGDVPNSVGHESEAVEVHPLPLPIEHRRPKDVTAG